MLATICGVAAYGRRPGCLRCLCNLVHVVLHRSYCRRPSTSWMLLRNVVPYVCHTVQLHPAECLLFEARANVVSSAAVFGAMIWGCGGFRRRSGCYELVIRDYVLAECNYCDAVVECFGVENRQTARARCSTLPAVAARLDVNASSQVPMQSVRSFPGILHIHGFGLWAPQRAPVHMMVMLSAHGCATVCIFTITQQKFLGVVSKERQRPSHPPRCSPVVIASGAVAVTRREHVVARLQAHRRFPPGVS